MVLVLYLRSDHLCIISPSVERDFPAHWNQGYYTHSLTNYVGFVLIGQKLRSFACSTMYCLGLSWLPLDRLY